MAYCIRDDHEMRRAIAPAPSDIMSTLGIIKLLLSYVWAFRKWISPRISIIGRPARDSVSPCRSSYQGSPSCHSLSRAPGVGEKQMYYSQCRDDIWRCGGSRPSHFMIIPNTKRHPNNGKTDESSIFRAITGRPRLYHNRNTFTPGEKSENSKIPKTNAVFGAWLALGGRKQSPMLLSSFSTLNSQITCHGRRPGPTIASQCSRGQYVSHNREHEKSLMGGRAKNADVQENAI